MNTSYFITFESQETDTEMENHQSSAEVQNFDETKENDQWLMIDKELVRVVR